MNTYVFPSLPLCNLYNPDFTPHSQHYIKCDTSLEMHKVHGCRSVTTTLPFSGRRIKHSSPKVAPLRSQPPFRAKMGTPAYEKVLEALGAVSPLPELFVFDLDYTLWPFWTEMKSASETPVLFPEVEPILAAIRDSDLKMALASRTPTPHVSQAFLRKLGLASGMFDSIQLIPALDGFDQNSAQKDKAHFPNLRNELGIEYNRMLFFDDEPRSVNKVSKLGVCSILVDKSTGVDVETFLKGLKEYAAMHAQ